MQFRTLGDLALLVGEHNVTPTAPKQRQALALMTLRAGQRVSVPTLIDEIWGAAPPRTATTALQTYVGLIRRVMAKATGGSVKQVAAERLLTDGNAYVLRVADGEWDKPRFEELVRRARAALDQRDPLAAESLLRQGLRLWHGQPLANVPTGRILALYAQRLAEQHMSARILLVDVFLQMRRVQEAVQEARELVGDHPYNEQVHAQLMRGLYASGRRAAALEVYQQLRDRMRDDLGISPSPTINTLHHVLLQDEPDEQFLALAGVVS
jgi:DNA-binding SARP family transcriptional activator